MDIFVPSGKTVALAGSTVFSDADISDLNAPHMLLSNKSAVWQNVFIGPHGLTGTVPVAGTPQNCVPVAPNSQLIVRLTPGARRVGVISDSGTANVMFCTPGTAR